MKKSQWQPVCEHSRKELLDGLAATLREKHKISSQPYSFEVSPASSKKWELRVLGIGTEYTLQYFCNWCSGYLTAMEATHEALTAMVKAYAPNADWSKPEQLHSAVRSAGAALGLSGGQLC
jgi:hypothetical protein